MGTVQKRRGAGAVGRTSWCGGVTSVVRGSTPLVHRGSGGAHHGGTKEVSCAVGPDFSVRRTIEGIRRADTRSRRDMAALGA